MSEKTNNFELLEPPSPDALIPDSWLDPWIIPAAVALIIALLIIVFYRKKKSTAESLPEVRNLAYQEALSGLENITYSETREVSVQCSLILRKYLSTAANDPSLFETHEEYLSRHQALTKFTIEARAAANQGFNRLSTLKYSKEIPNTDVGEVISESRTLLETLHHGFQS